jgi:hypothetical protein
MRSHDHGVVNQIGPSGTADGSSELVKAHTPRRGFRVPADIACVLCTCICTVTTARKWYCLFLDQSDFKVKPLNRRFKQRIRDQQRQLSRPALNSTNVCCCFTSVSAGGLDRFFVRQLRAQSVIWLVTGKYRSSNVFISTSQQKYSVKQVTANVFAQHTSLTMIQIDPSDAGNSLEDMARQ